MSFDPLYCQCLDLIAPPDLPETVPSSLANTHLVPTPLTQPPPHHHPPGFCQCQFRQGVSRDASTIAVIPALTAGGRVGQAVIRR